MRVNIYGPPNSGKSTIASKIFTELKISGYNIELVKEVVKDWTYVNKFPKEWDQVILLGHQIEKEQHYLKNGVDHIITDSPIYFSAFYSKYNDLFCHEAISRICREYDKKESSINIYLKTQFNYQSTGRFQDKKELEELINIMDLEVYGYLLNCHTKTTYIHNNSSNFEDLLKYIKSWL